MTIASSTYYTDWLLADGVNKNFSYDFTILVASNIIVEVRDGTDDSTIVQYTTGFNFVPNSDFSEGYITYPASGAALATGKQVRIIRNVPYTQTTKIGSEGSFDPKLHEKAFDKVTMLTQQLNEGVNRAITVPLGYSGLEFDPTIPDNLALIRSGNEIIAGPDIMAATLRAEEAAAEAAVSASDAVSQGNVPIYSSTIAVASLSIPSGIQAFRTNGHFAAGDGGDALRVLAVSQASGPGKIQSGDGRWWELPSGDLNVKSFGVKGDDATNDTAGINAAITLASTRGTLTNSLVRVFFKEGSYLTEGIIIQPYVWLDFGKAVIKKRSDGVDVNTNSLLRNIPTLSGGTYYGGAKNIKITGGELRSNGKQCPAQIFSITYAENLEIRDVTVVHSAGVDSWAFCIGGRVVNFSGLRVLGGTEIFQDGVHIYHGQYINGSNLYIESGDDAIALGGEPTDTRLATDPDPIRYVNITGVNVNTQKAVAVKMYIQSTAPVNSNWEITDVNISNISGKSGISRNGGITIQDNRAGMTAANAGIKRISINNLSLDVGSSSHDGTNPAGIIATAVNGMVIKNANIRMTSGAVAAFYLANLSQIKNFIVDTVICDTLPNDGGVIAADFTNLVMRDCQLIGQANMTKDVLRLSRGDILIADTDIREIKSGLNAIFNGATTSLVIKIRGGKIAHAAGASSGAFIGGVAPLSARVDGVDLSEIYSIGSALGNAPTRRVRGCIGLNSKISGSATIASATTSTVVTHSAPFNHNGTRVIEILPVSSWGSATKYWVTNGPGTNQFTINCDTAPGSAFQFNYTVDVQDNPLI